MQRLPSESGQDSVIVGGRRRNRYGAGKLGRGNVEAMVCPPEKHISVDSHELKVAIKNRLELEDRENFDDLCKLMEGVANFDFYDLRQRMRNNFLPFASGAANTIYLQRSSKNLPTTAMLDAKEDELIADIYEVLRASHYTLLTKEEWALANSENFNLNLPMKVNWDYMDADLLAKFWVSSPDRRAIRSELPDPMADRILVLHRGIGTERLKGLLVEQKLDLLMEYTVLYIMEKVVAPAKKQIQAIKGLMKKKDAKGIDPPQRSSTQGSLGGSLSGGTALLPADAAMTDYELEGKTLIASKHKFARRIERNTLARQCPTVLTLLKSFPLVMELQEPTFKDIVVVYRRALPARKPPTASANAPNKTKEERLQGILAHRNINIKVFGETPMADVEMIFPDKKVGIKPFQLVNLMATVIAALVAGALVLWRAGKEHINANVMWTAASLVLTRCFTVYTNAQNQRTMLSQQMTSTLYDKMQDSQEGVISIIMEEMADQQLKQILLAYMLLLLKDRAVLKSELDNTCEDFLNKEFDHPIDYDLDAALPRLMRWGLVKKTSQGKLVAIPMKEAIAVLESAWSRAYKFVGADRVVEGGQVVGSVPTIDMISGAYSVFGEGIDDFIRVRERERLAVETEAKKTTLEKAQDRARGITNKLPFGGKAKEAPAPEPELVPANVAANEEFFPKSSITKQQPGLRAISSVGGSGSASPAAAAVHSNAATAGTSQMSTSGSRAGALTPESAADGSMHSAGSLSAERKKSSGLKGMFKKLKG